AMLVTVVILHFKNPELNVLSQPVNVYEIVETRLNNYGALLALIVLQFWLGLRFKNFIAAIAIGISCWIIGNMLVFEFHSGMAEYFPYSFSVYSVFPKYRPQLSSILCNSALYALIFLVLAFIDFKRRGSKA
ncbi:MAG: hypothetical protein V4676_06990, partial [Bacteroidota bacterium]